MDIEGDSLLDFAPTGPWAGRWVAAKMDEECAEAARSLAEHLAEHIGVATGDAVTIRVVSTDGTVLDPLVANHPSPDYAEAMANVMGRHLRLDEGLWRAVFAQRDPIQWQLPDGKPPEGTTGVQADYIRNFRVRGILAAQIQHDNRPVGGIALVRFVSIRPFDENEVSVIRDCGDRLAAVLALYRTAVGMGAQTSLSI